MFKILSVALYFADVYSQFVGVVGGERDTNNCLISAGYSWCESSNSCIRSWETPCKDHYTSCDDCLSKQRNGMNIACPTSCDVEGPISIPLPETPCSDVMCLMYCENGFVQDDNGCNTCRCSEPLNTIDPIVTAPMPLPMPSPMPSPVSVNDNNNDVSVVNPFSNACSQVQMAVYHRCDSDCQNCDLDNTRTILNQCTYNNDVLVNTLCQGKMSSCDIPYEDCKNEFVCPKITEVTSCGENGLSGYSTYRLSLIIKNSNVKNIYAIYGDDEGSPKPMIIPPAYQSIVNFNSNIGGILPVITNIDPDAQYDSWLTVGITDGNQDNEVMTVGIDFSTWTETSGIHTTNGAVFIIDPEINIVDGDEYTVAQITIPNDRSVELTLNAQGKTNCQANNNCNKDNRAWKQEGIVFDIVPPERQNIDVIPRGCTTWFDGCNTCMVNNGQIRGCTRMMCFREENPYCTQFQSIGY